MKAKELKTKTLQELKTLLEEKRAALRQARFTFASGREKNVKLFRNLRKEIAKILTVLSQLR